MPTAPKPPVRAAPTAELLAPYLHLLGTVPDPQIEAASGVDKRLICKYRKKHGIACNRARLTAERSDDTTKVCSVCSQRKPHAEFCAFKAAPDGLDYRCRACDRARKNAANASLDAKQRVADRGRSYRSTARYAAWNARYVARPDVRARRSIYKRRYNLTPNGRANQRADAARWRLKPGALAIMRAHAAVGCALLRGDLIRPEACARCGSIPGPGADGRARIHAHHHSYARENRLDVEWICYVCHAYQHREMP